MSTAPSSPTPSPERVPLASSAATNRPTRSRSKKCESVIAQGRKPMPFPTRGPSCGDASPPAGVIPSAVARCRVRDEGDAYGDARSDLGSNGNASLSTSS
jgi:hypothetical protein